MYRHRYRYSRGYCYRCASICIGRTSKTGGSTRTCGCTRNIRCSSSGVL